MVVIRVLAQMTRTCPARERQKQGGAGVSAAAVAVGPNGGARTNGDRAAEAEANRLAARPPLSASIRILCFAWFSR
jgi:hypothetical protein